LNKPSFQDSAAADQQQQQKQQERSQKQQQQQRQWLQVFFQSILPDAIDFFQSGMRTGIGM